MLKVKRNVVSLLMSMVMLVAFCIPAMAAEPIAFASADGIVTMKLSNEPQPRFPGNSGIYGVTAAPAIMATQQYTPDYYSYSLGNGRTQYLHVTLDSQTRQVYNQIGADGFMVAVDMNLYDATRYEVKLNGEYVGSGSCAGYNRGTLELMLYNENPAIWEITLYDNTSQGKPLWGHIYYS